MSAQAVRFTEIMFDVTGSDAGFEWVEIHNDTDELLDLSQTKFFDTSRHNLSVAGDKGGRGALTLMPDEYAILADNGLNFQAKYASYAGTIIDTIMSLPNYSSSRNSPIELLLVNELDQVLLKINYMPLQTHQPDHSLEWDEQALEWKTSDKEGGSPGQGKSIISSPASIEPGLIRINEVFCNPVGLDTNLEWVELYNASDQTLELGSWSLVDEPDSRGSRHTLQLLNDLTFPPNSYRHIRLPGQFVNNSGEVITLISSDGGGHSQIKLADNCPENQSYAWFEDGWSWTNNLTPGNTNAAATITQPFGNNPSLAPTSKSVSTSSPKISSSKVSTPKVTSTPKSKSSSTKKATPKTSKPPKPVISPIVLAASQTKKPGALRPELKPHQLIILFVSLIVAVGFVLLKYRQEISQRFKQIFRQAPEDLLR